MFSTVQLYSKNSVELTTFLQNFFNNKIKTKDLYYEIQYQNPLEIADICASLIDNWYNYPNIVMWISIDSGVFINITKTNYNFFIQYLFERYPY